MGVKSLREYAESALQNKYHVKSRHEEGSGCPGCLLLTRIEVEIRKAVIDYLLEAAGKICRDCRHGFPVHCSTYLHVNPKTGGYLGLCDAEEIIKVMRGLLGYNPTCGPQEATS